MFQRRGQKVRARALAAKIANRRRHFLHVMSHALVRHYGEIYVGDVSPKKLAKTPMAKPVHDAGWLMDSEKRRIGVVLDRCRENV